MQNVIDQITDQLVSLVKSDKSHYNPNELLKAGIPSFVVERIRLFLEDKVREEIGSPSIKWFDADARLVSEAFQDYLNSAISSSFIPKSELYKVVAGVVTGIIDVFIEPRKKMAEYIFRDDDELSLSELELRSERVTIYKHFGTAIPLYMRKKKLDTLTKERCKLLIQKLDEKLVASYSAEDWAQKLEQLFILFGGKVHPMLLVTFFEDKGLFGMAGRFESYSDPMTKDFFIEILSKQDFKEMRDDAKQLGFDVEQEITETTLGKSFTEKLNPEEAEQEDGTLANLYSEGSLSDEEMTDLLADIASEGVIGVEEFEHVDSLNKLFALSSEEEENQVSETSEEIAAQLKKEGQDDAEEIVEFRENLISILDQAKSSFENISKPEVEEEFITEDEKEIKVDDDLANVFADDPEPEEDEIEEETIFEESAENEIVESEAEEKPIWAQFINDDHMDVLMGGERSKNREADLEEEFGSEDEEIEVEDMYSENSFLEEESIFEQVEEIEQTVKIEHILTDRKAEFIKVIFKGSESSYIKALQKLEKFGSWKETSGYIQKEIFAKNEVDMFSGATVDFTDRLHQYFNERSNN